MLFFDKILLTKVPGNTGRLFNPSKTQTYPLFDPNHKNHFKKPPNLSGNQQTTIRKFYFDQGISNLGQEIIIPG
jgi:hypothetical protein